MPSPRSDGCTLSFIRTPLLNDSWNIHRTIWKHSCETFKLYTKTQMWARRAAHKAMCSFSCSCPEAKSSSSLKVHTEHSSSYLKAIWGISHFCLRGFWQYFANIKHALIHFCLSASHVQREHILWDRVGYMVKNFSASGKALLPARSHWVVSFHFYNLPCCRMESSRKKRLYKHHLRTSFTLCH